MKLKLTLTQPRLCSQSVETAITWLAQIKQQQGKSQESKSTNLYAASI